MNRFKSRKKSHGDGDGIRRPSLDADAPSLPSFSSRAFRKKKKSEPEQKPQVNLEDALPSTSEFRTSLLMPNLSARFSMLREQDDPSSLIGKANDDSVLFPKRASRLDLFNSRIGLTDITEVDSIRGNSVPRPPFAQTRAESYGSDGYGTDEGGSVMSRSRPGEGNTMFGGRQKIYKIPVGQAGSVKNFGPPEEAEMPRRNMGGKALYESDTLPSAFQKARQREKEEMLDREDAASQQSDSRTSKEHDDRSGSPPMARYNRNRETTSSTNSGPTQSRASTAATSIASQKSFYAAHETIAGLGHPVNLHLPPGSSNSDRPLPKGKKMYGQGLDHHHHQHDPTSSLQRINSLHRQRSLLGRSVTQSKSATNLNEKFHRGAPVYTSNGLGTASPSPSPTPPRMQEFELGLSNDAASAHHVDSGYGKSPTASPPMSPDLTPIHPDATLVAALEPNDVGKATASGAFNKPAKQYDEQQYLQRQIQLQEGRHTPSPVSFRTFSPPAQSTHDQLPGRSRNNSQGSQFSRTNSMKHVWEHHMEDRVLRPVPERGRSPSVRHSMREESEDPDTPAGDRTFFGGSAPDSECETGPNSPILPAGKFQGFRQPPPPPPSQTRPNQVNGAFNFELDNRSLSERTDETVSDSRSYRSEATVTQKQPQHDPNSLDIPQTHRLETDQAGSNSDGAANGLSGLVHQHLRNVSNTSSVYPEDSPRREKAEVRESIFGHGSALSEQGAWNSPSSDHWAESDRDLDSSVPPVPQNLSLAARHILEQATAIRNQQESRKVQQLLGGNDKAQRVLGGEAPRTSNESNPSWQDQLKAHHARVGSTETQREREALASELEARKRIVRNNLQTFAEAESREASPAPAQRMQENNSGQSFGFLRKTNGSSPAGRAEKSSKAMKMLGLDQAGPLENDQPPPDMFMGREQYPDRAMPPGQRGVKPRPQDARQQSDESPTKTKRGFFGSRKPSPHSSKSGSDSSDRRPHSRKGSLGKGNFARNQEEPGVPEGSFPRDDSWNGPSVTKKSMDVPRTPNSHSETSARKRSRSHSRPGPAQTVSAPNSFEQRAAPPGTPVMINPSTRSGGSFPPHGVYPPTAPFGSQSQVAMTHPTMINPQPSHAETTTHTSSSRRGTGNRKTSINKQDISEPTFISTTSTFDTVDLPPGASLSNGMDEVNPPFSAPPIPVRDSRRRRGPNFFHAFSGRNERRPESPSISSPVRANAFPIDNVFAHEERDHFSPTTDSTSRPGTSGGRQQMRGPNLEGDDVNSRTMEIPIREQAPPMPGTPTRPLQDGSAEPLPTPTQHVPYQAQKDVPASAVMF